jgi:hypothetical protein
MFWRQAKVGQDVRCGAELHHDGCCLRTVTHRVTDDQGRPAARLRDDVMPVAANDTGADGQIAVRYLQALRHDRLARKQAALQGQRGPPLPASAGSRAWLQRSAPGYHQRPGT